MKLTQLLALSFAALGVFSYAQAQDEAASKTPKLKAYVQMGNKPQRLELTGAQDGNFIFIDSETGEPAAFSPKSCKLFFIQTPAELAAGVNHLMGGDYAAARKVLASCKKKYAAFAELPGNPSTKAAVLELEAAMQMIDIPAVKDLRAALPAKSKVSDDEKGLLLAAEMMGKISDESAAAKQNLAAIDALLQDKAQAKILSAEQYAIVCYARARALSAGMAAATSADAPVDKAQEAKASAAIDSYCQAVVASHGAWHQLAQDAACRAMYLLYGMPGVKETVDKLHGNINKKTWASAPQNMRDAVSLAMLYKNVYAPEQKNALADKLSTCYYAPEKGAAPEKKPAPAPEAK